MSYWFRMFKIPVTVHLSGSYSLDSMKKSSIVDQVQVASLIAGRKVAIPERLVFMISRGLNFRCDTETNMSGGTHFMTYVELNDIAATEFKLMFSENPVGDEIPYYNTTILGYSTDPSKPIELLETQANE